MNKIKKIVTVLLFPLVAACSGGNEGDIAPPAPPTPDNPDATAEAYHLDGNKHIFGFTGQDRYAYCPSVIEKPWSGSDIYFCGNPTPGIMEDNIYHIHLNADGTKTAPVSVLKPGVAPAWDNQHCCDPSVVAGNFNFDGTAYKYAMFYLGCTLQYYYNEIGVAFSNDLNATEWVKYPDQIIEKTWPETGDQNVSGGKSWGVGQPSAISLDKAGKVLLSYTIGDIAGTRIVSRELNLTDMSSPVIGAPITMTRSGLKNISESGLDYTCNSDIALDADQSTIYMIRPVQPHPADYPAYLNQSLELCRLPLDDFIGGTGTWEPLFRLTPELTGYARNHNAGIARDAYGHLSDPTSLKIYYTVSKASPEVAPSGSSHAEWTYHIWEATLNWR